MKRKLKLKKFVVPTLYGVFVLAIIVSMFLSIEEIEEKDNLTYVSSAILDEYVPVVAVPDRIIKPYTDINVYKLNDYYDYENNDNQENSIIKHDNIYLQNTGINYTSNNQFEILSILNGEVIDVSDNDLLGKSVTIRHDNELISVYQCINDLRINKGDKVVTGQVIGNSGSCELLNQTQNNLHIELYINGTVTNPENYYNQRVN